MSTASFARRQISSTAPRRKRPATSGHRLRSSANERVLARVPLDGDTAGDLAELGRQAKLHHDRIVARAVEAACDYWLLGRVLLPARRRFKKGEWYAWLERHEINRHRADRGRLLAGAFGSLDQLAGLTVEAALARAKQSRPSTAAKLAKKLRRRLRDMARSLERTIAESAALAEDRAGLCTAVEDLGRALDAARDAWADTIAHR